MLDQRVETLTQQLREKEDELEIAQDLCAQRELDLIALEKATG